MFILFFITAAQHNSSFSSSPPKLEPDRKHNEEHREDGNADVEHKHSKQESEERGTPEEGSEVEWGDKKMDDYQ